MELHLPSFILKSGLKQGFPLSPLLFLLVMEGINGLIKDMHLRGRLIGIKMTDRCMITHLLFVDDMLIFLNGGIGDQLPYNTLSTYFKLQLAWPLITRNPFSPYLTTSLMRSNFLYKVFPSPCYRWKKDSGT